MAGDLLHWQPVGEAKQKEITIVPRGLRSFGADDANFFLDLLPGPRNRDALPESIQFWKTRIEETDPDKTFSVGLIYGPSGCGKSSLVKAGLLPRLSGVVAIYVEATPDETETRILRGLRKQFPELPDDLGLVETFALLRRGSTPTSPKRQRVNPKRVNPVDAADPGAGDNDLNDPLAGASGLNESLASASGSYESLANASGLYKVVIVLDQFEQWLHAHRAEQETDLVAALRQCDGRKLQAIVMVRDDFAMAASRFMRELETRIIEGHNFATVDLFDVDHARSVLIKFGQAFAKLPAQTGKLSDQEQQFVSAVASGLAQDGKVVSVRLALFAEMVKGKPWVPATLQEVGGTEG